MTQVRRQRRQPPAPGAGEQALIRLLVQLGEIVRVNDFGPMEPVGYGDVRMHVAISVDDARAAYEQLHRMLLGRAAPRLDDEPDPEPDPDR
jgi:hypothetical protein